MKSDPLIISEVKRRGLRRVSLEAFARTLCSELTQGREFSCLLSNDEHLQRLNRQFCGKDYATDVLSFPSLEPVGSLGDIAISVDRAVAQAAEQGHDLDTELRILLLHGVLHLLGHDHETDKGVMRRLETRLRKKYALPAGLIERTR